MTRQRCALGKLTRTTFLFHDAELTHTMKESYHCLPCDKEFIDREMAKDHRNSTGHEVIERKLEK